MENDESQKPILTGSLNFWNKQDILQNYWTIPMQNIVPVSTFFEPSDEPTYLSNTCVVMGYSFQGTNVSEDNSNKRKNTNKTLSSKGSEIDSRQPEQINQDLFMSRYKNKHGATDIHTEFRLYSINEQTNSTFVKPIMKIEDELSQIQCCKNSNAYTTGTNSEYKLVGWSDSSSKLYMFTDRLKSYTPLTKNGKTPKMSDSVNSPKKHTARGRNLFSMYV